MDLQLLGMPVALHQRIRRDVEAWASVAGHRVRFVPSRDHRKSGVAQPDLALVDENVNAGYTRVVLVPFRNADVVASRWRFDCRVLLPWRGRDPVKEDAHGREIAETLEELVSYEREWDARVAPRDTNHPLILPRGAFVPAAGVGDFWIACDCYRSLPLIDLARNVIERARGEHERRPSGQPVHWEDAGRRRFSVDRSMHARSDADRAGRASFRFCLRIPPGFHFDVTHADKPGQEFRLTDLSGVTLTVRRANVTPWAVVRPAD